MDYRRLNHVITELALYAGMKRTTGDSTFVLCPFHGERTPSGRIFHSTSTKSPGYFKCYGCGHTGKWDEVAPRLGLRPYKYAKPQELNATPVVRDLEAIDAQYTFEHKALPKNKIWRKIETNLLISIGCSLVEQYGTRFVYMPVLVKGEERGFIRARLKKEKDKPSYLNKAGRWSEQFGLFPYDYSVQLMQSKGNAMILVEGPRDALRLLSAGLPACAILGTQSWSKRKAHLLEIAGAETVITCFDGDDAGLKAKEIVTEGLERLIPTVDFTLTGKDSPYWPYRHEDAPAKAAKAAGVDLWDPGNMPDHKLAELKALYRKTVNR